MKFQDVGRFLRDKISADRLPYKCNEVLAAEEIFLRGRSRTTSERKRKSPIPVGIKLIFF